jgi:hypothetical protein
MRKSVAEWTGERLGGKSAEAAFAGSSEGVQNGQKNSCQRSRRFAMIRLPDEKHSTEQHKKGTV